MTVEEYKNMLQAILQMAYVLGDAVPVDVAERKATVEASLVTGREKLEFRVYNELMRLLEFVTKEGKKMPKNDFSGFLPEDYKGFFSSSNHYDSELVKRVTEKSGMAGEAGCYPSVLVKIKKWSEGKKTRARVLKMDEILRENPEWHWSALIGNAIEFYPMEGGRRGKPVAKLTTKLELVYLNEE